MGLRRVTREAFVASPFGNVTVGPSWLLWARSPNDVGSTAWGRPSVEELEQAFDLWDALWARLRAPVSVVTDISTLEAVPERTFAALARFVAPRLRAMASLSTRQLVWVGSDVGDPVRALGVGFLASLGARHDHRVTHDRNVVLEWLAHADAEKRLAEIASLRDDVRGVTPLLRTLRDAIEARLHAPAADAVARAVGMSERTLQRRLAAIGTTFRDEVNQARCVAAARLLMDGERKIVAVAEAVGIASASHFASLFKQQFGMSPHDYRTAHRSESPTER